jgi:hypothetical protein
MNTNYIPKCFIWNKISLELDELINLSKTHKLLCLYDSKENSLQDKQITSNKLNDSILRGLTGFVTNKTNKITKLPVIILNGLSTESIKMIKSDPVLKAPKLFNISVIFIGSNSDFDSLYNNI